MKYQFGRNRSDLWIVIHENDGAYNISVNEKYIDIIDHFFPDLEDNSPTKWKRSMNRSDMSNLWLPADCYNQNTMNIFLKWCEEATQNVLWLKLNQNFSDYFDDELDYCIASDFNYNFNYQEGRTEIGEAEYQLKYNTQTSHINFSYALCYENKTRSQELNLDNKCFQQL